MSWNFPPHLCLFLCSVFVLGDIFCGLSGLWVGAVLQLYCVILNSVFSETGFWSMWCYMIPGLVKYVNMTMLPNSCDSSSWPALMTTSSGLLVKKQAQCYRCWTRGGRCFELETQQVLTCSLSTLFSFGTLYSTASCCTCCQCGGDIPWFSHQKVEMATKSLASSVSIFDLSHVGWSLFASYFHQSFLMYHSSPWIQKLASDKWLLLFLKRF